MFGAGSSTDPHGQQIGRGKVWFEILLCLLVRNGQATGSTQVARVQLSPQGRRNEGYLRSAAGCAERPAGPMPSHAGCATLPLRCCRSCPHHPWHGNCLVCEAPLVATDSSYASYVNLLCTIDFRVSDYPTTSHNASGVEQPPTAPTLTLPAPPTAAQAHAAVLNSLL